MSTRKGTIRHGRRAASQSRSLRRKVQVLLMLFATGFSTTGCNSSNHSAKRPIPARRAIAGGTVNTQPMRAAAVAPVPTSIRTTEHRRGNKTNSGPLDGLGNVLKGTARVTACVAIIAGVFIGAVFVDHQVGRLGDKMF